LFNASPWGIYSTDNDKDLETPGFPKKMIMIMIMYVIDRYFHIFIKMSDDPMCITNIVSCLVKDYIQPVEVIMMRDTCFGTKLIKISKLPTYIRDAITRLELNHPDAFGQEFNFNKDIDDFVGQIHRRDLLKYYRDLYREDWKSFGCVEPSTTPVILKHEFDFEPFEETKVGDGEDEWDDEI